MPDDTSSVGPSTHRSGVPDDLTSVPAGDVDAAETGPPPATWAMILVRQKRVWLTAAGLLGAGLLLAWHRNRRQ